MTYRNDKTLTFELLVNHAFRTLVLEGMSTPDPALITILDSALVECRIPVDKAAKVNRRAIRLLNAIVKPFEEAGASVAKFGLTFYYVLREFVDEGRFVIEDGSSLDKFCEMLLSDEGSLVELANIAKVDSSAMKQAKKMREMIRKELGV